MKSIIVKNIQIQFDSFADKVDANTAIETIEAINGVLQERFPDISPQIFVGAIDDSDIEITDMKDDDYILKEECIIQGTHLDSCDDDGFCNHCGEQ